MRDFFPVVFISILLTLFYSEHTLIALEIRKKKNTYSLFVKLNMGIRAKGENSTKSKGRLPWWSSG